MSTFRELVQQLVTELGIGGANQGGIHKCEVHVEFRPARWANHIDEGFGRGGLSTHVLLLELKKLLC